MIHGVMVKELTVIPDDRGWLFEVLRSDEPIFERFGQLYVTTVYPGVVKAWHCHRLQSDYFACVKGMIKLALYDARDGSPTFKEVNEFYLGDQRALLVKIPPHVYHGFKAVGPDIAFVLNTPTLPYNREAPDEYRLPPDTGDIPYSWPLTPGLRHG